MIRFKKLFNNKLPAIIGMIHVQPLPGTPTYVNGSLKDTIKIAKSEASLYLECGVDGLILENMHDIPYMNRNVGPEITSTMAVIAHEIKNLAPNIPCGIQILAGCNKEALAVAKATSLDFIRAEGFVFSHVADEGLMNSDASQLLRYRKIIDADDIMIFTDVKKKHSSHAITQDLNIAEVCRAAEFFMSDGVVITGISTGQSARTNDVQDGLDNCNIPVLVGSGVTPENFQNFTNAHGVIVGSYFKDDGYWKNNISKQRVLKFMDVTRKFRRSPNY